MQQMQDTIDADVEMCAALVLDVVPLAMRRVRAYMREARAADLSVPQFRALAFLRSHPGATLSELADHVGLTLPAASRMIDGLVARDYAERQPSVTNRRCVELRVSDQGRKMLEVTRRHTQNALARLLQTLNSEQRDVVMLSLETLREVFSAEPSSGGKEGRETSPEDGSVGAIELPTGATGG
jgi:DNA-binding MarR family transcriptional regulator